MNILDQPIQSNIRFVAVARGSGQIGVDQWEDWSVAKTFTGAATIEMLDRWAKQEMGPKATWAALQLSPLKEDSP